MDTINKIENHNQPPIDVLAEQWLIQKNFEQKAREARIRIEEKMLPLLETKEEGSKTTITAFDRKITVTQRIDRKLDSKELMKVRADIPADLLPLRISEVIDLVRLRYLQNNEPDTYRLIARAIVSKPGKPHIKVETSDEE